MIYFIGFKPVNWQEITSVEIAIYLINSLSKNWYSFTS